MLVRLVWPMVSFYSWHQSSNKCHRTHGHCSQGRPTAPANTYHALKLRPTAQRGRPNSADRWLVISDRGGQGGCGVGTGGRGCSRLIDLEKNHVITSGLSINYYRTQFKHEFRQALSLSLNGLKENNLSVETFLRALMKKVREQKDKHLHILSLFGAPFDALLTIITDDGTEPVVRYEDEILSQYPFVTKIQT